VKDHVAADVAYVKSDGSGFLVVDENGRTSSARNVVVAVGVTGFGRVPHALCELEHDPAVSFANEQRDFACFAGRRVVILGGGQGALDAALWCVRSGAEVELIVRSNVTWFADREPWRERTRVRRWMHDLAYPVVGYGPPVVNRLAVRPDLFALLPAGLRMKLTERVLRSGGSPWLRREVQGGARILEGATPVHAHRDGDQLELTLSDGSVRRADHVLLGTGYAFDLARLDFLAGPLRARIGVERGWPRLDRRFGSTVPGLYFVGFASEGRFGPAARFVLGSRYAAPTVARAIAGSPGAPAKAAELDALEGAKGPSRFVRSRHSASPAATAATSRGGPRGD
jgi:hypothetical protein